MDRNPLELVSEITEFNDLHEFMQDEQLDKALEKVVKLMMKPDVPPAAAQSLIVQLQATSAKCQILSATYATILKDKPGTDNYHKKNIYYSVFEALDKLVAALKYLMKSSGMV